MAKMDKQSPRPEFFAKGGSTKMFGRGTAHSALPDISGKEDNGGEQGSAKATDRKGELEYGKDFTFNKGGGPNEMFGKGHAGKKVPGISGKASQEG